MAAPTTNRGSRIFTLQDLPQPPAAPSSATAIAEATREVRSAAHTMQDLNRHIQALSAQMERHASQANARLDGIGHSLPSEEPSRLATVVALIRSFYAWLLSCLQATGSRATALVGKATSLPRGIKLFLIGAVALVLIYAVGTKIRR